jgi:hypothetical protein
MRHVLLLAAGLGITVLAALWATAGAMVALSSGADAWYGSGATDVETTARAMVVDVDAVMEADPPGEDGNEGGRTRVKIGNADHVAARAEGTGRRPVFIGIGPQADIERYLDGVAQDRLVRVEFPPLRLASESVSGARAPAPPAGQPFWQVSAQGLGQQQVEWSIEDGDYAVVVMNADGSAGISAELAVGVGVQYFTALALLVTAFCAMIVAGGLAIIVRAVGALGRRRTISQDGDALLPEDAGPLAETLDGVQVLDRRLLDVGEGLVERVAAARGAQVHAAGDKLLAFLLHRKRKGNVASTVCHASSYHNSTCSQPRPVRVILAYP